MFFFAKFILGYDWLEIKIHGPLCKILEQYETIHRVRVTLPRSWLKSTVCSISYPLWRCTLDPNIRCLLVQNTADNARAKLRSIRGHFETNQLFRILYSHLLPDRSCRWTTAALEVKRSKTNPEATFEAAGRATQLTGRHYNIIDEDDTVAPDKDEYTEDNVLPTKDDIGQAIGWHRAAIPLLVDHQSDQIIVVGTRWFQVDLLSWIEDNETWYTSYELAVRMTAGKPDPNGEIVWEKRFGEESLRQLEISVGPYLFSCLYLNHPLRSEDMIFQKKWFQFYAEEPKFLKTTISVDPAGNPKNSQAKRKKKNDFNVVLVTGTSTTGIHYVLNYKRFKGSPGELIDLIFEFVKTYKPEKVGIEGIAYQESLEYFVTEEMRKRKVHFNIELLKHGGKSKDYRIQSLQPLIRNSTMLFKPWMYELVSELEMFPLGVNDDLADALAMQLQLFDLSSLPDIFVDEEFREASFELDDAIRSIALKHRPPVGSHMDLLTEFEEGAGQTIDPYSYLWEESAENN